MKRCSGHEYCKTKDEIDNYATNTMLAVVLKASIYDPEQFISEPVTEKLNLFLLPGPLSGGSTVEYHSAFIQEEILDTDDKFYSLGVFSRQ